MTERERRTICEGLFIGGFRRLQEFSNLLTSVSRKLLREPITTNSDIEIKLRDYFLRELDEIFSGPAYIKGEIIHAAEQFLDSLTITFGENGLLDITGPGVQLAADLTTVPEPSSADVELRFPAGVPRQSGPERPLYYDPAPSTIRGHSEFTVAGDTRVRGGDVVPELTHEIIYLIRSTAFQYLRPLRVPELIIEFIVVPDNTAVGHRVGLRSRDFSDSPSINSNFARTLLQLLEQNGLDEKLGPIGEIVVECSPGLEEHRIIFYILRPIARDGVNGVPRIGGPSRLESAHESVDFQSLYTRDRFQGFYHSMNFLSDNMSATAKVLWEFESYLEEKYKPEEKKGLEKIAFFRVEEE